MFEYEFHVKNSKKKSLFKQNFISWFLLDHDKQLMLKVDEYNVQLIVYEIKVLEQY